MHGRVTSIVQPDNDGILGKVLQHPGVIGLSAADGASGQPVIFTTTGPATVNGNTLTITGGSSVVVSANQAGNGNYNAEPAV